ncbi:MAG: YggS family pyridoxal phosphate-dependent enzyme [Paenibacillaceae bacterium]
MHLKERISRVEARIQSACIRAERNRDDIHIIGVTKYVDLSNTRAVLESGIHHLGENRWHNAKEKWEAIGDEATWHFIGHLQTNKTKDVVGRFTYIHSLDRIALLQELDKKAAQMNVTVQAFIQVNVSGEESKYGLSPDQLFSFVAETNAYPHVQIVGLMTMAPHEVNPEHTRPVFRGLRMLRDELNERAVIDHSIDHLSMGMSNDYEIAVEEGSTWLRLGSVLFTE